MINNDKRFSSAFQIAMIDILKQIYKEKLKDDKLKRKQNYYYFSGIDLNEAVELNKKLKI